jgi:hypothetical protein
LPTGVVVGFVYRLGQLPELVGRHGLAHHREILATSVAEHHAAQRADLTGVAVGAGEIASCRASLIQRRRGGTRAGGHPRAHAVLPGHRPGTRR